MKVGLWRHQKTFEKKKRKTSILNQCHSAEKLRRGDPLNFLKLQFAAKYQKNLGGPFGEKKLSRKKSYSDEKNSKGDPVAPSSFVSYVKNEVNKRGTLCTNLDAFPVAGPVV